jgi:hypothetical protein
MHHREWFSVVTLTSAEQTPARSPAFLLVLFSHFQVWLEGFTSQPRAALHQTLARGRERPKQATYTQPDLRLFCPPCRVHAQEYAILLGEQIYNLLLQ